MNKWEMSHSYVKKIQSSRNFCLVKDEIGKAKPTIRNLPPPWFTYGKSSGDDYEGAGIVTRSWQFHTQSPQKKLDINFVQLNRVGLLNGKISSRDFRQFRKQNDDLRFKAHVAGNTDNGNPNLKDFIFGKPCRPPTPINGVLGNLYGNVASQHNDYIYEREQKPQTKLNFIKPSRAQQIATSAVLQNNAVHSLQIQDSKSLFKMKKFQNIRPRTESYSRKLPTAMKKMRFQDNEGSLPQVSNSRAAALGLLSSRSVKFDSKQKLFEDKEIQCMSPFSQHLEYMHTVE